MCTTSKMEKEKGKYIFCFVFGTDSKRVLKSSSFSFCVVVGEMFDFLKFQKNMDGEELLVVLCRKVRKYSHLIWILRQSKMNDVFDTPPRPYCYFFLCFCLDWFDFQRRSITTSSFSTTHNEIFIIIIPSLFPKKISVSTSASKQALCVIYFIFTKSKN